MCDVFSHPLRHLVWALLLIGLFLGCQQAEKPEPLPTRLAPATWTLSPTVPTASFTPSQTVTPSPTIAITATHTPFPTLTPSASPTETLKPFPTATPSTTTSPVPSGSVSSAVGAYVRSGPGIEYEIVDEVTVGVSLGVLAYAVNGIGETWYLITLPDGQRAWISADVISLPETEIPPAVTIPPTITQTATITLTPSPTVPQGANAYVSGAEGVNLREGAGYSYPIIKVIENGQPLVLIGRTQAGDWLQVVTFDTPGLVGWVNADYVDDLGNAETLFITWSSPTGIEGIECGVNVSPSNGQGLPANTPELSGTQWVRFPLTVSGRHFPTLDAAFRFFDPIIQGYNLLGVKVLLVLTHETYGEGGGWQWLSMGAGDWAAFTPQFAATAGRVAAHYGNQVAAYEIWNEGDSPPNNAAAVSISPESYAHLLDVVASAIRAAAPNTLILNGGFINSDTAYLRRVVNALGGGLPVDALALHPYGRGQPDDATVFSQFGSITEVIEAYRLLLPDVPIWLTEVGAIGDNSVAQWTPAADYMRGLFTYLRSSYADAVDVIIWYGWSDAMHPDQGTNGLVTVDDSPKSPLYETFFNLCKER